MHVRWAMLAACLNIAFQAAAGDWDADEKAVWQLEEDYWRFVSAGDVDSYVKLWHDDFVGWPCFEWNPARKGDIGKWVRDIRDNKWILTYQLKPLEVQEFGGDTVVVHYAAEYVYDYGDGTKSGVGDSTFALVNCDQCRAAEFTWPGAEPCHNQAIDLPVSAGDQLALVQITEDGATEFADVQFVLAT